MTVLIKPSFTRVFAKVGLSLLLLSFLGCKGKDITDDSVVCEKINNQTYFAQSLGEGGHSEDGIWLSHWSVSFKDGSMSMSQSDFGMSGQYSCEDGEVLLTSSNVPEQALNFSEDMKSLYFNPFSSTGLPEDSDLTYVQAPSNLSFEGVACKQVMGKTYIEKTFAELKRAADPKATMTQLALSFELQFSEGQKVEVLEFGERYTGIFDCALDELHVHRSQADESPILGELSKDGQLSINSNGQTVVLVEDIAPPIACTAEYNPVCAAKNTGIVCVTTPCPTQVYQTYSNQCGAEADGSTVLFSGECGDLEGEPIQDKCTKENVPVCGAVVTTQPCSIMPCPAQTWGTFTNQCLAQEAGATHIMDGDCGSSENQIVTELPPSICTKEYFPICGKSLVSWECQGDTPCFTHQYNTYGNACELRGALAEYAFEGECGELANVWAYSQPLVKMKETLPVTSKSSSLSGALIDGDVLHITLGYSGCSEQHFDFHVSSSYLESFPVQASYVFTPQVEDACEAYFETAFEYDLIPLKVDYQKAYQSQTGKIDLGELGLYEF